MDCGSGGPLAACQNTIMEEFMDSLTERPFIRFGDFRKLCSPIGFVSLRIETMPTCAHFFENISKVPDSFNDKLVRRFGCVATVFVEDGEQDELYLPCLEVLLETEG